MQIDPEHLEQSTPAGVVALIVQIFEEIIRHQTGDLQVRVRRQCRTSNGDKIPGPIVILDSGVRRAVWIPESYRNIEQALAKIGELVRGRK